jgi:hypothetical protein
LRSSSVADRSSTRVSAVAGRRRRVDASVPGLLIGGVRTAGLFDRGIDPGVVGDAGVGEGAEPEVPTDPDVPLTPLDDPV